MPRQLRLLLPAACAKELAPPSQPASTSPPPHPFLILLSAAFQAQWDTWPGEAALFGLILSFLGDDFGLSMSKCVHYAPPRRHLLLLEEVNTSAWLQRRHYAACRLSCSWGLENNLPRPQICVVWKPQFIVGPDSVRTISFVGRCNGLVPWHEAIPSLCLLTLPPCSLPPFAYFLFSLSHLALALRCSSLP